MVLEPPRVLLMMMEPPFICCRPVLCQGCLPAKLSLVYTVLQISLAPPIREWGACYQPEDCTDFTFLPG